MTTHRSTNRGIWVDASAATERLQVKRATLYTYVSRGWVRSRSQGGRARQYNSADIEALAARSAAHAGREARAASALDWGEPVLTTSVSAIDADGPYYRGVPALDLLGERLEQVAERLWGIEIPHWPTPASPACNDLLSLRRMVDALAADDPDRVVWNTPAESERAARIVGGLREAARLPDHPDIEAALVLVADHGLNASTFAARVIASTGADLYACISGALAALSGPRHGTASLEVHYLLDRFESEGPDAVLSHARHSGALPGFGHPLYPHGDPRAEALLGLVELSQRVDSLRALIDLVAPMGLRPNLDVGLLGICLAHELPPETASRVFAVGRSVGWVAHVFEQREQPGLLRPRASYRVWHR